jgi:glycosyltransferase involved in cell wall biosynthesis
MNEIRITAIIPNFNHAQYLRRSIGAVVNQSVPPHEVIVIDDASTDNSLEVLNELARNHPVIRLLLNERNLGVHASLEKAMAISTGDYIACYSADDEILPGVFENARRMFQQYPQAAICSGLCEWRDTATGMTWYKGTRMPDRHCYLSPDDMVSLARRGRLLINNQSAVIKKSALVEVGGWRAELKWFSDWWVGYVIGFRHGICHVPEVLSNFFLYPTSYYSADAKAHAERRAVMNHLLELLESDAYADVIVPVQKSGLLGVYGWQMVRLVISRRRHWRFLTLPFIWQVVRRWAEVIGRRFFPDWLARWCLKVFYGLRSGTGQKAE